MVLEHEIKRNKKEDTKDEMFPDEDFSKITRAATVIKDSIEEPKKVNKIAPEGLLYQKIESLWESFANGHKLGNITKCNKLYKDILAEYKQLFL